MLHKIKKLMSKQKQTDCVNSFIDSEIASNDFSKEVCSQTRKRLLRQMAEIDDVESEEYFYLERSYMRYKTRELIEMNRQKTLLALKNKISMT